jgi:hypothetical protein
MNDNGFRQGNLEYTVRSGVSPTDLAELVSGVWSDGYVAFANGERRLAALEGARLDSRFLSERVQGLGDVEGYVTELNLWRSCGSILEEIAVEREENSYLVQSFRLVTEAGAEGNCWYREASTSVGSHHKDGRRIFSGDLQTVEVVWPEKRLNIYITRGA